MGKINEPSVADLYRAFAGLMNTAPGHSPERNQAIAHADLVQNLIERSPQWQATLRGEPSEAEKKSTRYDYLIEAIKSADGLPSQIKDCLDGHGGDLNELIDANLNGSSYSSTNRA